ncbi:MULTISPECIES: hypothetical protein [Amycolatopsis]|uniref:Uncharacterized protein n=2 Tax=Amycolatopsis TaxID=1813 RepID=A0A1I3JUE0_9PSEU|nr:hypothetical protein [Amycolatopsis sacchari]SFI63776.1 hypothetical protein SAMN05421835_101279 [Amycolatopsis sacchari]
MDKKTEDDQQTGRQTRRPDDTGSQEEREVRRGEQGTSTGDPHDDFDPQQG